ncbi:Ureidoglycolate lyase [Lambiella insularis]|nr:Ureidoglycolate lyase [Lambiella insularis]
MVDKSYLRDLTEKNRRLQEENPRLKEQNQGYSGNFHGCKCGINKYEEGDKEQLCKEDTTKYQRGKHTVDEVAAKRKLSSIITLDVQLKHLRDLESKTLEEETDYSATCQNPELLRQLELKDLEREANDTGKSKTIDAGVVSAEKNRRLNLSYINAFTMTQILSVNMAILKRKVKAGCIQPEALSLPSFEPYGHVIEDPEIEIVGARGQGAFYPQGVCVNQGTAFKYAEISPLLDRYHLAPYQRQARPVISLFVCSPRHLITSTRTQTTGHFIEIEILERHPYTTQTFTPMGLDPEDTTTAYLVVVAPTIAASQAGDGTPDTENMKAFLARGYQAVTYAAGTWHAPMIVIGKRKMSFVVTQHVNGVAGDDCQEIELDTGGSGLFITVPEIEEFFSQPKSKL